MPVLAGRAILLAMTCVAEPTLTERLLVMITARDADEADRLAEALVGGGLAAGVNMVSGRSVYRWKGEVCRHSEVFLFAQTTAARFPELEQTVRELHSYDVPCVLAVPLSCVSEGFGNWIESMTAKFDF